MSTKKKLTIILPRLDNPNWVKEFENQFTKNWKKDFAEALRDAMDKAVTQPVSPKSRRHRTTKK